jgi:hypothetical protein
MALQKKIRRVDRCALTSYNITEVYPSSDHMTPSNATASRRTEVPKSQHFLTQQQKKH